MREEERPGPGGESGRTGGGGSSRTRGGGGGSTPGDGGGGAPGGVGGRSGWWAIAAYGLLAAATQTLWLTYAPITTDTASRYGVSVSAVGWLSEIFPLLYVLLAVPSGALLDRWFRPTLAAGGALVAAGGLLRLGGQSFAWAMAGQTLVAIAQPVVMSAVGKLAGEYLPVAQRPAGISAASAAGFVGMLVALLLGPALGGSQLTLLLQVEAVLGVLAALTLILALRSPGQAFALQAGALQAGVLQARATAAGSTAGLAAGSAAGEAAERAGIERGAARALWRRREIRIISALAFLGFGAFVALSTWLQALLHPDGVSDTAAGALLVGMILAGVAGCALIPPFVQRAGAERGFMRAAVAVGCLGSVALAALPSLGARAVAMVAIGAMLLPALPVILTIAERIAGPAAGTAGAIVWMAGNLGGLIVALIVQALVHDQLAAFLALAAVIALGLPFANRVVSIDRVVAAKRGRAAAPGEIG